MTNYLEIFIITLFYASLFYEIFFVNIPSVASTQKIFSHTAVDPESFSGRVRQVFDWPYSKKILIFIPPLIFVYTVHLMPLIYYFDLFTYFNLHHSFLYLGLVLVLFGRLVSLNFLLESNHKIDELLITKGVFKYTRNPGLVGLYISFLGLLCIYPSLFFLFSFCVYAIYMHLKILMEENYLERKFGNNYFTYKSNTRRYI